MTPISRMRTVCLILATFLAVGGDALVLDDAAVSGGGNRQPGVDLTLLPAAPRWARWATTSVFLRYTARGQAPARTAGRGVAVQRRARVLPGITGVGTIFNSDLSERPQNETSIAMDPTNSNRVVGVYHDYRLGTATASVIGWSTSRDAAGSLDKDGQIPGLDNGCSYPRCIGGEPTVDTDGQGNFFVASLYYDGSTHLNGIGIARSPKAGSLKGVFSTACTGGGDPDCWPTVKAVTASECTYDRGYFDDNPYVAVDDTTSPAAGQVYVVWTRFACPLESAVASSIMIAKCDNALTACTVPAPVDFRSGTAAPLDFVQQPHIAIAPGGGVYVVWVRHSGSTMETEVAKIMLLKIKPTSSTTSVGTLGALRTVYAETKPIPWGFAPYPGYFRTSTRPRAAVSGTRVIVAWDRRTTMDTVWASPGRLGWWFDYGTGASIVTKYSDDYGATWSGQVAASSAPGPQYQPSICVDPSSGKVAVAYYSHQNAPYSAHAQDVYLAISGNGGAPYTPLRVTAVSNDTQADPTLSDVFIGDRLDVACRGGIAYVHFTANYASKWYANLPGVDAPGVYVNQQDNFLVKVILP